MDLSIRRRRTFGLLVGLLAPTLAVERTTTNSKADKRKKRKRKRNKNRSSNQCWTGPCTYDLCLIYVESIFSQLQPSLARNAAYPRAQGCCGRYALTLTGAVYRDAVVACLEQYVDFS